jgi:hypothetical protein
VRRVAAVGWPSISGSGCRVASGERLIGHPERTSPEPSAWAYHATPGMMRFPSLGAGRALLAEGTRGTSGSSTPYATALPEECTTYTSGSGLSCAARSARSHWEPQGAPQTGRPSFRARRASLLSPGLQPRAISLRRGPHSTPAGRPPPASSGLTETTFERSGTQCRLLGCAPWDRTTHGVVCGPATFVHRPSSSYPISPVARIVLS